MIDIVERLRAAENAMRWDGIADAIAEIDRLRADLLTAAGQAEEEAGKAAAEIERLRERARVAEAEIERLRRGEGWEPLGKSGRE